MEFIEGSMEGEKVFGHMVFPKTLLPPRELESPGVYELVELVKRERGRLSCAVQQHGAILFRGFCLASADDFTNVVEAFGWSEFAYEGLAIRTKVAHRVYTTNEIPLDVFIPFHHEMALIKKSPSKLFFLCLQPSPEGGQTSLIPSEVIVEKMEEKIPDVVERLVRDGMRYVIHTKTTQRPEIKESGRRVVWQEMLETKDKGEAEERAVKRLACKSVKFNDDETADFKYGPMNPVREMEGKRVWFNSILPYAREERVDTYATFHDATPFPSHAISIYQTILDDNCVDVSWQKGDLLLVNNFTVQHARRPGKPPRLVLLSLCN